MRVHSTVRHSATIRRHANMAASLQPLQLLCLVIAVTAADPAPGRVPKVYNALITSNQNLEPSKAYPVYQPVLHDFGFPFQPAVFYGDYPIGNGLQPIPAAPRKNSNDAPPQPPAQAPQETGDAKTASSESPPLPSEPSNSPPDEDKATPAPPLPPNTESPIPLNQFGLPPQVLPLGRFDPAYNGFNQIGPFTYSYPSVRFYDPYDPFSLNPYVNFPQLFRPLPNILGAGSAGVPASLGPSIPVGVSKEQSPANPATPAPQSELTPPPEPSDLNLLNYSSKDPAIPNVPPPPLPQGGLKADNSE